MDTNPVRTANTWDHLEVLDLNALAAVLDFALLLLDVAERRDASSSDEGLSSTADSDERERQRQIEFVIETFFLGPVPSSSTDDADERERQRHSLRHRYKLIRSALDADEIDVLYAADNLEVALGMHTAF